MEQTIIILQHSMEIWISAKLFLYKCNFDVQLINNLKFKDLEFG